MWAPFVCVCVCVCARARERVVCESARTCLCNSARARARCTCVRARCVCRVFFCWAFSLTARLVLASLNPRPRSLTPLHTICEHGSGAEERTLLPSNPGRAGEVVLTLITKTVASTNHRLHFRTETNAQRFRTETDAQHAHRRVRAYAQHNATLYTEYFWALQFSVFTYAVMLQHVEVQPISSVQLSGLVLSANVCNKSWFQTAISHFNQVRLFPHFNQVLSTAPHLLQNVYPGTT